jgi:hypothetical protein
MGRIPSLPSYEEHEGSPRLEPYSPGIAVSSVPVVTLGSASVFPLYGTFVLPKPEASKFTGHLLEAVVILLRGPNPATVNVGKGQLLFEDDLRPEAENIYGFFNLDLFESFGLVKAPNRYRVSASIFQYVSDVITIDVVEEQ